jgi:Zn-dependent protease with chaperone function
MLLVVSLFVLGVLYALDYWVSNWLVSPLVNAGLVAVGWLFTIIFAVSIFQVTVKFVLPALSRKPRSPESKDRLSRLALETLQRMSANPKVRFVVGKRFSGAYVRKDRIVVGERLLEGSSDEEIIGVVGHEVGHVLKRHKMVRGFTSFATFVAFMAVFILAGQSDFAARLGITTIAGFALVGMPLNWKLEYAADVFAAERLGANTMVLALEKLRATNYDGVSFSHPPLSRRIRRIQTLSMTPLITHIYAKESGSSSV